MMSNLSQFRIKKIGCDLIIKVDGREIPVHHDVMKAGSHYFNALLSKDEHENQSEVVEIKDISYEIFEKCVEFIYTGEISLVVEECEDLLFAASLLQLTSICDSIPSFLQKSLSPSLFFVTKRIADKFSLGDLKKACDDFASKNLAKITCEKEFNNLDKECVSYLVTTKKSMSRKSEDSKLVIILQWIKADVENRSQHVMELITLLNLRKVSPSYMKYLIHEEQLCYKSLELMRMFLLASINDRLTGQKQAIVSFGPPQEKLIIADMTNSVLRAYSPSSKKLVQLQELPSNFMNMSSFVAVLVDDCVFFLLENGKAFKMNIQKNGITWERTPDMKRKHGSPSAQFHGGFIYVVGDHSMERYCISERKWEEVDCSNVSNCNKCAFVVHYDYIYTFGGHNGRALADANRFSPSSSSWLSVTPMPFFCHSPTGISHGYKIYVAGGYYVNGMLNDFLSFNPIEDSWTQLNPMLNVRHCFSLCIVAEQLYAVGNFSNGCSIETYDFEEESWINIMEYDYSMRIMAPATVCVELDDP